MNRLSTSPRPSSPSPSGTAMSPTDRHLMRSLAATAAADPIVFLRLMLQRPGLAHDPMAEVHRQMQAHLSQHRLALVELPRDHGKTTQVCLRTLWELAHGLA